MNYLLNLGSIAHRDNFKPVLNPPKNHPMIATTQAKTDLPFLRGVVRRRRRQTRRTELPPQDSASNRAVNCAQLSSEFVEDVAATHRV